MVVDMFDVEFGSARAVHGERDGDDDGRKKKEGRGGEGGRKVEESRCELDRFSVVLLFARLCLSVSQSTPQLDPRTGPPLATYPFIAKASLDILQTPLLTGTVSGGERACLYDSQRSDYSAARGSGISWACLRSLATVDLYFYGRPRTQSAASDVLPCPPHSRHTSSRHVDCHL